jgi:uncharacterized glyoxalase superfamily protein PhnB
MTSILAQLSVRRGRAAIDFYKAAFGAVEDYRVGSIPASAAAACRATSSTRSASP